MGLEDAPESLVRVVGCGMQSGCDLCGMMRVVIDNGNATDGSLIFKSTVRARGDFDVLVGINLLREGLDLPEVMTVAILDADKEGFLRSESALIQTVGRAARNDKGRVVMYADTVTDSMRRAIDETNRRRTIQDAYNKEHGITPKTVQKDFKNTLEITKKRVDKDKMSPKDLVAEAERLKGLMKAASAALDFEKAIKLRDELNELKKQIRKFK